MNELIGRNLGAYRIVEQIGIGGMATVLKAYQPSLDRYVAIKVLAPFHAEQPGFSERFQREARAVANLNHPNILPVFDFGQEGDYTFIAMRYVAGARTLKEVMETSMGFEQIADLIKQIAGALDHAHQQGIIHRDVKPSNVLIDGDWALLADFGIAKMTETSVKLTGSGVGIGTPAYMSPEQGQGLPVDNRTDIYSLGVILFEMTTGQIPHDAETPFGIVLKRISEPLPLPRAINAEIPEAVEKVVLKALARNPNDRFQTASEMASALEQAVAGESVVAEPQEIKTKMVGSVRPVESAVPISPRPTDAKALEPPPEKKQRPRWLWAVTGAFIMLIAMAGVMLILQGKGDLPAAEGTATSVSSREDLSPPRSPTEKPPNLAPTATATSTPVSPPTIRPTPSATPTREETPASLPPPGSWQSISDLPRQINALAMDPGDPRVLYAGTGTIGVGSGVYKSQDAGLSWQRASDGLPSEDVRALAFSHSDPPTLFADVGPRGDVYASTDGAQSWTRLGSFELTGYKAQMVVAPSDANVLFITEDVRGAYRSLDGGRNWLPLSEGLPTNANGDTSVQSVAIDPTDTNIVYLGTGWSAFNANGVYKSTDGGGTWTAANRGLIDYSITALAVDPMQPQVVYAGAFDGNWFRSDDGGQTWRDLSDQLPLRETDRSSILAIAIDPEVPETVYLLIERVGVLVTDDRGARWHVLGKPGELEYPMFSAMVAAFGPQSPIVVVGVRDEGGWRYATD